METTEVNTEVKNAPYWFAFLSEAHPVFGASLIEAPTKTELKEMLTGSMHLVEKIIRGKEYPTKISF